MNTDIKLGPFTVKCAGETHNKISGMYYAFMKQDKGPLLYLQRDGTTSTECDKPHKPLCGWFKSPDELRHAYQLYYMVQTVKKFRALISDTGVNSSDSLLKDVLVRAIPNIHRVKDISDETNSSPTQEHRPEPTDNFIEQGRLAAKNMSFIAAYGPVEQLPLADASAQAISGGKTANLPFDEQAYKAYEALPPEQRPLIKWGSWHSDYEQPIHQFAKDAEFGPDESHIDPHQEAHEAHDASQAATKTDTDSAT